jgi:cytochrome c-type protein NapC
MVKNTWLKIKGLPLSVRLSLLAVGIAIGLLLSLPAVEAVHFVSTNEFCVACHSMKTVDETFSESVHGGNNNQGFVADCGSCHLPTSNVVHELWVKGTVGMRHVFMEYIAGTELLDHEDFHARRIDFNFESSCLNCHRRIEPRAKSDLTEDSPVSDQVHKIVFEFRDQEETFHCANCHFKEAHPGLKERMRTLQREQFIADAIK